MQQLWDKQFERVIHLIMDVILWYIEFFAIRGRNEKLQRRTLKPVERVFRF